MCGNIGHPLYGKQSMQRIFKDITYIVLFQLHSGRSMAEAYWAALHV